MVDEKIASDIPAKDRKRILLVDDDREIIESMRIALESEGYQVLSPGMETRDWPWPNAKTPIWSSST